MNELNWRGEKVLAAVRKAAPVACEAAAATVWEEVVPLTPVGRYSGGRVGGNLRSSMDYGVIEVGPYSHVGWVGTNVHYGPWVEMGTRKMAPRGMLRRGLDLRRDHAKQLVSEILGKAIERSVLG